VKTKLQGVTDLPFHLCETIHGFGTKQATGFSFTSPPALLCKLFIFHYKDKKNLFTSAA